MADEKKPPAGAGAKVSATVATAPGTGKTQNLTNSEKASFTFKDKVREMEKHNRLKARDERAMSSPENFREAFSVKGARVMSNLEIGVTDVLGSKIGSSIRQARRAEPGKKLSTFGGAYLRELTATIGGMGIVGETIANKLRSQRKFEDDPQKEFERIQGNFMNVANDLKQINQNFETLKANQEKIIKADKEVANKLGDLNTTVEKVKNEFYEFQNVNFREFRDSVERRLTTLEGKSKMSSGIGGDGSFAKSKGTSGQQTSAGPSLADIAITAAGAGAGASVAARALGYAKGAGKFLLRRSPYAIAAYGLYKGIETIGEANEARDKSLGIDRNDPRMLTPEGQAEIETKRREYHGRRKRGVNEEYRAQLEEAKKQAGQTPSTTKPATQQKSGPLGLGGFPSTKPTAQQQYAKRFKSESSFGESFDRQIIEREKSSFLQFGQLPRGFEFLPGQMGRLGSPEAVAATGAMPLGGYGEVAGVAGMPRGGYPEGGGLATGIASPQRVAQSGRESTYAGGRGVGTGATTGDVESLRSINANQLAFLRGLGMTETGFRQKEAYSEALNKPHNNANVRRYGQRGADYGFYQTNEMDVQDAIRRGVPPEISQHLHGGGKGGTSTTEQQTVAMHEYLKRKYPKEYEQLKNGRPEDFEAARARMQGQWFGLKDRPQVAAREFVKAKSGVEGLFPEVAAASGKEKTTAPTTEPTSTPVAQPQQQAPSPGAQQQPGTSTATAPAPGAQQQAPGTPGTQAPQITPGYTPQQQTQAQQFMPGVSITPAPQLPEFFQRGIQSGVSPKMSSKTSAAEVMRGASLYGTHIGSFRGLCGVGTRSVVGSLLNVGYFTGGLGTTGAANAAALSGNNNYLQKSGFYNDKQNIGKNQLTKEYLDSLPIGTVISSAGGKRGLGHVQVKIGPGHWVSDADQKGMGVGGVLVRGYDNFAVHLPNEKAFRKMNADLLARDPSTQNYMRQMGIGFREPTVQDVLQGVPGTTLTEEQKKKFLEQKYQQTTGKDASQNQEDFEKWKSEYGTIEGTRRQAEMVPGTQITPEPPKPGGEGTFAGAPGVQPVAQTAPATTPVQPPEPTGGAFAAIPSTATPGVAPPPAQTTPAPVAAPYTPPPGLGTGVPVTPMPMPPQTLPQPAAPLPGGSAVGGVLGGMRPSEAAPQPQQSEGERAYREAITPPVASPQQQYTGPSAPTTPQEGSGRSGSSGQSTGAGNGRNNPESSGASPGSGGMGSYGRCFV